MRYVLVHFSLFLRTVSNIKDVREEFQQCSICMISIFPAVVEIVFEQKSEDLYKVISKKHIRRNKQTAYDT